jgi:hypothetical protein
MPLTAETEHATQEREKTALTATLTADAEEQSLTATLQTGSVLNAFNKATAKMVIYAQKTLARAIPVLEFMKMMFVMMIIFVQMMFA